ncbi:hypothetical protein AJ80_09340 [Polytolypa hystricis UAMH7299]|uniref:Uncharacterized protein n=1 Tax=Polytolypa hystricis (strain UAMH7299) TaxID=1447883 RepID=A0A2B7WS24_POLH7|nr:hypothetical protein AJ80_09340 [Polytolypa hystricis UAMH7299]
MTALAHSILGPCVPRVRATSPTIVAPRGSQTHACCASRSEWDDSRVRALHVSTPDAERAVALEQVQRGTTGAGG